MEKAVSRNQRPGQLFLLVQALIFGAHAGFLVMIRALGMFPGGLGWFMPCSIGANHSRLRHTGWEKVWTWFDFLASGFLLCPLLGELLVLFGYPSKFGAALLEGTLPLRYCTSRFARKVPTGWLPAAGKVAGLLAGVVERKLGVCALLRLSRLQLTRLFREVKEINLGPVSGRG